MAGDKKATATKNPLVRLIHELFYNGLESIGKYYSSYRGIVADNTDPLGLGRVQLVIPEITGNEVHDYWAFPKGLFSGKGYGIGIAPQKGDLVWVEFEQGNVETPIFTFGYKGKGELPDDPDCKDPNVYWFFTPKGNKIKINDTKNYIQVESKYGDKVVLNSSGISLEVDTKKKRQISLGKIGKSSYKAVKGDKVKEALKEMGKFQSTLVDAIKKDVGNTSSPFLSKAVIGAALPQLNIAMKALEKAADETLSDIVTLE